MNITMNRLAIIEKLTEMMPLYVAEDKRIAKAYEEDVKQYVIEMRERVSRVYKMKAVEFRELVLNRGLQTALSDSNRDKYRSLNPLDGYPYNTPRPQQPRNSYEGVAKALIKTLELSTIRNYTLSQDGKYSPLYHLITFEPRTETEK